tara:strand:+ start:2591 stop:3214 length:624 start_codon:yes stop_codon:yes gene_type:complete
MNYNVIFSGIYSPRYEEKYNIIKKDIISNGYSVDCIKYKKLPQSYFQVKLGNGIKCRWCLKEDCTFIFHWGDACKIEHIIELCKNYKDKLIIYTDTDIKFNNLKSLHELVLIKLKDNDIVFQKNNAEATSRWISNINIGFNAFYATDKILSFFLNVHSKMKTSKNQSNWDQQVVNLLLYNNPYIKYFLIDNENYYTHFHYGYMMKTT